MNTETIDWQGIGASALLILLLVLSILTGGIMGYYKGIAHSMEDSFVDYDNGMVRISLDGHEFIHYVGREN